MSEQQLHLDEPTTVAIAAAGLGRIRVVFDAGPVDPQTPQEQAAADWLATQQAAKAARAAGAGEDDAADAEAGSDEVPGRVDDVKAWVGDDTDRAKAALQAERARAKGPRTTLEPWLVEAAGLADGDDAPDAGD